MGSYAAVASGSSVDLTVAPEPELSGLAACPQTARYHGEGDVATHTELVLGEAESLLAAGVGRPAEAATTATILRLAALLHDVGKPATTTEKGPGCFSAHGHAAEGARITAVVFDTDAALARLPLGVAAAVHALVRDHMWSYDPTEISTGAALRMAHLVDPALLVALWRADTRGRICADAPELADQVAFAELALAELGADVADPWLYISEVCDPAGLEPRVAREALRAVVTGRLRSSGAAGAFLAARERAGGAGRMTYTIGLPGSGKSTWARSWAEGNDGVVLSAEGRRRRDRKAASIEVANAVPELLRAGASVCVDATHVTRQSRDKMLAAAEAHGATVDAVYLHTPLETCLGRQSTRPWRDTVGEATVVSMRRELRWPTPDEYATLTVVEPDGSSWAYGPATRFADPATRTTARSPR